MDGFLEDFVELARALLDEEIEKPVAPYIPSSNLSAVLDLELKDTPMPHDDFKEALRNLVLSTPRVASKGFFNQLFGGRNSDATLGELLSVMLNNSMYTYKAAGPMVAVEKAIINGTNGLIGWKDQAGGILAPGGSMANMMAMIMARDSFDPDIKHQGFHHKLIAYTSENAHYSILKNASFLGIGRDQVREIPCDSQGRLSYNALVRQVEEDRASGFHPFFVNLTAGTTVLGAFDPIKETAQFCESSGIWLHVDGAYCGGVIFSDKYRYLIDGVNQANSFCLNAHKMIGTPLSCSILLTKNSSHLHYSFSNDASYLYQTDGDDYNLGKISMQCGRRNDALKFWTLWKKRGTKGLGTIVDTQFELADYARDYINGHPDYTLYSFKNSLSVCFNYKGIDPIELCTMLYQQSQLMVGIRFIPGSKLYTSGDNQRTKHKRRNPVFFRCS